TRIVGLAGLISLNELADPQQGGNPEALRDGMNFAFNPDNNTSFNDLLIGFTNAMDAPIDFVTIEGTLHNTSLMTFSTSAVSWFGDAGKAAAGAAETKDALIVRTTEALSNIASVNLDEEMAVMLELEQSYAASARMLQVIDEMLQTLLSVA